jgi:tetratricopeptide (TPR) repeat protein
MEDYDLDAAIAYWERDIEIEEESGVEFEGDVNPVFHHAGHMLVNCLFERATVFSHFNFPEQAIDDYTRILEVQDTYPVNEHEIPEPAIYSFRGWELLTIAEYEDAIADYDSSIEIMEELDSPKLHVMLADNYMNRGYTYYFLGEVEKAKSDIDISLELNDDSVLAKCVAIEVSLSSDSPESILDMMNRDYQKCENMDEDSVYIKAFRLIYDELLDTGSFPDIDIISEKASEAFDNDNFEEAAILYKTINYLEPENPVFTYNLALSFAHIDDNNESLRYYYRYLYLDPDTNERDEIMDIINELQPQETMYDLAQMYKKEMGE